MQDTIDKKIQATTLTVARFNKFSQQRYLQIHTILLQGVAKIKRLRRNLELIHEKLNKLKSYWAIVLDHDAICDPHRQFSV